MDSVLVFGHKNPDTDSICSAIAYSELKNKKGQSAKPARLGDINKETEFALKYFNLEFPEFIDTVSPQISDLTHVEKETVSIDSTLKSAFDLMSKENIPSLPVVNKAKKIAGMIRISDIANAYLEMNFSDLFTKYHTLYENLKEVLQGEIISGDYPEGHIKGRLVAASEVSLVQQGDIVLGTVSVDTIDQAIDAGARVIIVCGGEGDEIAPRENSQCAIMKVEKTIFKAFRLITQSISISSILDKERKFFQFKEDDFLNDIKDTMKESEQTNFPVVDREGKIYGTIRPKNLINFTRKKVILVDHNEKVQSVEGIEDARILEVIDHHKFGNFETSEPLSIKAETVGSSSTLVYELYKESGIEPSKGAAGAMLSAILSDTLLFKSPTCTEKDITVAKELAAFLDLDYEKYGMEMLIAGTSLGDKTSLEIINMDMKEFHMSGLSIAVAQVNTVDVEGTLSKQKELEEVMNQMITEKGYDAFILAITDIINSGSQVISIGKSANLVEIGFDVVLKDNSAWLEGVVSRKKQLVPFLIVASQSV